MAQLSNAHFETNGQESTFWNTNGDEQIARQIRGAAGIADAVMRKAVLNLEVGVEEYVHAARIEKTIESLRGELPAFDATVSFGTSSADPHHIPDETQLALGDVIVMSFGCVLNGAPTQLTRTFFYGDIDEEKRLAYGELVKATEMAFRHTSEGTTTQELRMLIEQELMRALPQCSVEAPSVRTFGQKVGRVASLVDDVVLSPGLVVCVEAGINVPQAYGLRISNTVLVTDYGCEVLNRYPFALSVMDVAQGGN